MITTIDQAVLDAVQRRDVTEIVHFTTQRGVLGILATGALKSRARLLEDQYLKNILKLNVQIRQDDAWLDYANFSVTSVNERFFGIVQRTWHKGEDLRWAILSFDAEAIAHKGVHFATTNNMYTGVRQASGVDGFEALFADRVHQFQSRYVNRPRTAPANRTTCDQAEVLYPGELSSRYLRRMYVRDPDQRSSHASHLKLFKYADVEIVVAPDLFERSRS